MKCNRVVPVGAGDINPDTAIVPADVLSKQALDGQAEDLAMEDTLYALEKAMQAGSLTPDVYIKQVRLPPLPLASHAEDLLASFSGCWKTSGTLVAACPRSSSEVVQLR